MPIEQFFQEGELPEGWTLSAVDDVSSYITDGTHKTPTYTASGVRFLSTANVVPFRAGFDFTEYERFISKNDHEELTKRCKPERGDVLISKCGTIGRTKEIDTDSPFSIFVGLALLKPLKGLFASGFLEASLNSPQMQVQFDELSPGSTRRTLALGGLKSAQIPVPPLAEQKRMVERIRAMLARTYSINERLSRIPSILKRFRQAVLAAACSGKLTEDWRAQLREPRSSGREFADLLWQRRLGENSKAKSWLMDDAFLPQGEDIPDNWYWESLSRCTDVRDGTHDSPKYHQSGIPLVTSKNLVNNRIDFATAKFISLEDHLQIAKRSAVEKGDVLFAMIGTIGNPTIVNCDRSFSIKNVALFRTLGDPLLSRWLSIWLESPPATRIFQEIAKGSTQPFVPLNVFRSLPIPLPPTDELGQIMIRVDQLLGYARKVEKCHESASRNIDKLAQSILTKAFRGELVPTEAELARREGREYEHASVLLERIKKERESQVTSKAERKRMRPRAGLATAKGQV